MKMYSVYKSVHVLSHAKTHKLLIHTYVIHNDITKHKQSEATVGNVNRIKMIVTANLNKIISKYNKTKVQWMCQQLRIQLSGSCSVSPKKIHQQTSD